MRYKSRTKERIEYRWHTDGVYVGSAFWKNWIYKRDDGSEFVNLKHPITVERDLQGKPFVMRFSYLG